MGKQNLRDTCPKGKLEFKFFSSPKQWSLMVLYPNSNPHWGGCGYFMEPANEFYHYHFYSTGLWQHLRSSRDHFAFRASVILLVYIIAETFPLISITHSLRGILAKTRSSMLKIGFLVGFQEVTSNTGGWVRPNDLQMSYRITYLACIHSLQAMRRLSQWFWHPCSNLAFWPMGWKDQGKGNSRAVDPTNQ